MRYVFVCIVFYNRSIKKTLLKKMNCRDTLKRDATATIFGEDVAVCDLYRALTALYKSLTEFASSVAFFDAHWACVKNLALIGFSTRP